MFNKIFATHKKVLIPFIMAGVPNLDESFTLARAMIEEGAKILELGVPFSDPSADGEVLQQAAEVALNNKVSLREVLVLAQKIHAAHPEVPIVLFTYLNPLLAMGLEDYVKSAVQSGVAATLTVDLPLEEADEYRSLHETHGLKTVFLASPTTQKERMIKIDQACTGFLYYISRSGVTGMRSSVSSTLDDELALARSVITSPMAIGFGVSHAEQAREISLKGDAVVIGSAYMRIILQSASREAREESVRTFTRECVRAIE